VAITADHVNSIILSFLAAVEAQGITVEKALLFGSQARGNATDDSDFDLIVISNDFAHMAAWQRWEILGKAAAKVMEPIEALAYSPDEVATALQRKGNFLRHILTREKTVNYVVDAVQ
jgi:predicted nucleotidyltransferase